MVFKARLPLFAASIGAAVCYRLRRPFSLLAEKQVDFFMFPPSQSAFLGGRWRGFFGQQRTSSRIIYFSFLISTQGSGWGSSPSR